MSAPKGTGLPTTALLRGRRVSCRQVGGFPVYCIEPAGGTRRPGTIVYFHGGAFVSTIAPQHWSLVAEIADASGRTLVVPLYGLAPRHVALEAVELGRTVAMDRSAPNGTPAPLHLAGDSAGGGLALLVAQRLRASAAPHVDGVTVIAPWLDLSMANSAIEPLEPSDPWLARSGLRPIADVWRGGIPLDDPRVSPIHGELANLPPVTAYVGSRDITAPDTRLLVERIRGLGGRAVLHETQGSPHVHPLLPTPEGRDTRRQLVAGLSGPARGKCTGSDRARVVPGRGAPQD